MSEPAIDATDLTFAYDEGTKALDAVTFRVLPGESVGLVGPNGAGKTSLFLCLSGVLAAQGGTLRVAGLDLARRAARPSAASCRRTSASSFKTATINSSMRPSSTMWLSVR